MIIQSDRQIRDRAFNEGLEEAARLVERNADCYGEKTTARLAVAIRDMKRDEPSGSATGGDHG